MARELAIENGKLKSNLDANGKMIVNLAAPVSDNDAATKKYVDERPTPPPSWSDITGKPDTFPPEAHTHTSDSWFTSALEAIKSWASGAFAAITHSHASDNWFTTAIEDVKLWAKSLLPDWLTPSREEPPTLESVATMIRTAVADFDPDEQSFADLVNILKNIGA